MFDSENTTPHVQWTEQSEEISSMWKNRGTLQTFIVSWHFSFFKKKKSFTSVFLFQLGLTEKKGICVVVLHSTAALVHKMTLTPAEVLQG